jgi:hypothetical protein
MFNESDNEKEEGDEKMNKKESNKIEELCIIEIFDDTMADFWDK